MSKIVIASFAIVVIIAVIAFVAYRTYTQLSDKDKKTPKGRALYWAFVIPSVLFAILAVVVIIFMMFNMGAGAALFAFA